MTGLPAIFKKQRASTVLGLSLDGNRLEGVVVRRLNGSLQVQQTVAAPLALPPLTGDPELVGREIRNHLDQAGVRERRCALCIPLNWLLTLQVKVPDLPEADVASFLQIEAERGFHAGLENLFIATSRCHIGTGEDYATLVALPRTHVARLEAVLKAAQLKPLSYSLGVTALGGSIKDSPQGVLTLSLGAGSADLLVGTGGGILTLRALEGVAEGDGAQKRIDADIVAREIRITLGQLPPAVGGALRNVRVCGRGEIARQFVNDITPRLDAMGLKLELLDRSSAAQFDKPPAAEIAQSPALALAANYVLGLAPGPELLPPKVQPWQQFLSAKVGSRKLVWAGATAGGLVLIVAGAFLFQEWQIDSLDSQLKAIAPDVKMASDARDNSRKFGAWANDTFPGLRIMQAVAQAFPLDGNVTAKSLEIHDLATVTCSGNAGDNQAYLRLLDRLNSTPEINTSAKTDTVRGQDPLQFVFNFEWEGGEPGGN
jgi:hypothetical protein